MAGCLGIALLWILLAAPSADALCAEVEYTGAANGKWQTEGNWSGGKLPTSAQTVCIPAGKGVIEVPSAFKAEAKTVQAGSEVKIASTGTLAIAETGKGIPSASTFSGLEIDAGGHLSTVAGWIFLAGNVLLEGEISTSKPTEALVRLTGGTLAGNGTVAAEFNNEAGTLQPGGAGVIGTLHFTMLSSQSAAGTLTLDLASKSSFDRVSDTTSNFFWFGTLAVNLLESYSPVVGEKWEFMSAGPGDETSFEAFTPGSFTARSVPNGSEVEALPGPPIAVTEPASSIAAATAVLNGAVNPNNESVTACNFEYGSTTSYGSSTPCSAIASHGTSPVTVSAAISGIAAGATYHFRIVAKNAHGAGTGLDRTFNTLAGGGGETPPANTSVALTSSLPGGIPVASTAAAIEALRLGCSRAQLVLNDAYIHGSRVALIGSAAKGLLGKKVKIIFGTGTKQVATATVGANGQYSTTAPLPPVKIREALTTRYTAEIGSVRSLHLKLTRRLLLEAPKASSGTVTLSGQVTLPLTKPIAPVVVEQQLECGRTTIADTFTPPANGRFRIALAVPAAAKAGIYTLKSKVAANAHATAHGFTTYSLPLPVIIGG